MFVLGKLSYTRALSLYQRHAHSQGRTARPISQAHSTRERSGAWVLTEATGARVATVKTDTTVRMEET